MTRTRIGTAGTAQITPPLPGFGYSAAADQNRELLSLIVEQKPESISELARLSDRSQSNLTRTLKKMESYGLVKMKTGSRGSKQPLCAVFRYRVRESLIN